MPLKVRARNYWTPRELYLHGTQSDCLGFGAAVPAAARDEDQEQAADEMVGLKLWIRQPKSAARGDQAQPSELPIVTRRERLDEQTLVPRHGKTPVVEA
jgi:hypothetical protein